MNKSELAKTLSFRRSLTVLPITNSASFDAMSLMETFFLSHGLRMPDALIAARHGSITGPHTLHTQLRSFPDDSRLDRHQALLKECMSLPAADLWHFARQRCCSIRR